MMFNRGTFQGMNFGQGCGLGGWGWLIGLGAVLLIIAVTYLIVQRNRRSVTTNSSALELLKMKFVQGEITQEEYEKRKNVLESK